MSDKNDSGLAWAFSAIGLAVAGFASGLNRLVWTLYWVLALLWFAFFYHVAQSEHEASLRLAAQGAHAHDDQTIYWLLGIGAPLVVAIILRIVEGVVFSIFGG